MSLLRAILCLCLTGCAAQPERPKVSTPELPSPVHRQPPEPSSAASTGTLPVVQPAVEEPSPLHRGLELLNSGDYRRADPLLREELASGPGFRTAALALAGFYRSREAHIEAEPILRAALVRDPDALDLNLMQARVYAETNRWQEAAEILRASLLAHPESASLSIALVAAERALGRLDEAASLLGQVLRESIADPRIEERIDDLRILAEELAEERRQGRRLSRTANELLAQLRAGESPALRRDALKTLVARASTRLPAVLIAIEQPDPLLRVLAVRAWPVDGEDPADFARNVRILFSDPDARVRAEVSGLATRLARDSAVELLLAAMEKEQDGYAFRTMHADLSMILATRRRLYPGAEDDADARALIVQKWRETWHR